MHYEKWARVMKQLLNIINFILNIIFSSKGYGKKIKCQMDRNINDSFNESLKSLHKREKRN